jgi:hypothetical protein
MKPSLLESRLWLTRQVFMGEVTRAQLAQRPNPDKAFVGVAIMLAAREQFLDGNNVVKGSLTQAMSRLLSEGTFNAEGELNLMSGSPLAVAAGDMELYRRTPGRSGGKRVELTPPPQLVALVNELGVTPAIQAFFADAVAGAERARAARAAFDEAIKAALDRQHPRR